MLNYNEVNPFKLINALSGLMMPEIIIDKSTSKPEFAFLVCEETNYINKYKNNPVLILRIGILDINNVGVMPMMLLVNDDYDMLYESHYNYHRDSGDRDLGLKLLSE